MPYSRHTTVDVIRVAQVLGSPPQYALGAVLDWLGHWEDQLRPPDFLLPAQSTLEVEAEWKRRSGQAVSASMLAWCGLLEFSEGEWRVLHLEEPRKRARYAYDRRRSGEASAAARRARIGTAKPGAKP